MNGLDATAKNIEQEYLIIPTANLKPIEKS